jgi:hypothetical protein
MIMKKLAALLIVGTMLSGCATTNPIATFITTGVVNPITNTRLASIESGYGIALSGAVAYRNRPRCTKTALESVSNLCARRSIVVRLQSADRQAQIALGKARAFVSDNPTLDPSSLLSAAEIAVSTFGQIQSGAL